MDLPIEKRLATIREAAQMSPTVLFEGRVRHWVLSNRDGFADLCVIRRGGRIFIDLDRLKTWLEDGRHRSQP